MQEINLNGKSLDIVKENVTKLKQLFPEIVTEDNIDFDKLKAVLGEYIEKDDESYRFTWYGKRDAFRKSQIPSTGTLRPCIEESKDWDTTENLYIEGDNLEVLKLLQKSYNNKIKMIYIDPPYNKDKDFIYTDKWSDPIREYKKITGQIDEGGNITSSESEEEGGRHTNWLNMIYPRLRIARNLLTDDGVILISIGDDELANLQKICDEIFGAPNLIGIVTRLMKTGGNKGRFFSPNIDYILVYAKDISLTGDFKGELDEELVKKLYNKIETEGERKGEKYRPFGLYQSSLDARPNQRYYIECPDGSLAIPPGKTMPSELKDGCKVIPDSSDGCWRWSLERYLDEKSKGNLVFIQSPNGVLITPDGSPSKWNVYSKIWLSDRQDDGQTPTNFISKYENRHSAKELKEINISFDFAKPVDLIKYLISLVNENEEMIVMDFFSGSSTTAHSVMQINAEDKGKRKYIMVQLPEITDKKDEAYKAGFKNICELGKERIRRAGNSIKAELKDKYDAYQQRQQSMIEDDEQAPMNPDDLDIGFKVFKLDNSNLKKWSVDVGEDFYKESKEVQNAILTELLFSEVDNFVEGRSELDVVYEIMLKYGLDLTYPIETYDSNGTNIYSIGYGGLIVCLDKNVKAELADKIVELIRELEPSMVRVAVRDLSFESDSVKTNFKETLKNGVYAYFDSSDDKADKQNQFKFITI